MPGRSTRRRPIVIREPVPRYFKIEADWISVTVVVPPKNRSVALPAGVWLEFFPEVWPEHNMLVQRSAELQILINEATR
jgi:hypothetical protein